MSPSKTIACFVGPMLVAFGLSMLLNRAEMTTLAMQVSNDFALIFMSGALLLLAGIAIVRVHNIWSGDWRVIVTVVGWLAVISGLVRILFFRQLAELASVVVQWSPMAPVAGAVMLALGSFLTLKATR